jgi:transposase
MIIYKASLCGIEVVKVSEAHTSQRCPQCGKVSKANRRQRGEYACACGWKAHADVNAAANLYERFAHVSPLKRSSGRVASTWSCRCDAAGIRSTNLDAPSFS